MRCGLCAQANGIQEYAFDEKRAWRYFICGVCDLVFRDPETYLKNAEEKARYETHNNSIENEGYVRFLSPVVELLSPYLKKTDHGLDYGCGPGPILETLFSRLGFRVENYDPYFFNDKSLVEKKYDFITCTEAIEHFYEAQSAFTKMNEILKPEGLLLLMTDRRPAKEKFLGWGYRMDNTHVCFYSTKTFEWIANHWGYEILFSEGKLSLFRKKS